MPRIPDRYLDCVFYLYANEEDARAGRKSGGTGFFVSVPSPVKPLAHVYAVTNWHVACRLGCSVIRVMRRDGSPEILPFDPSDWQFDPDGHDIAIVPISGLSLEAHQIAFQPRLGLATRKEVEHCGIGTGEDVFMIGRFVDHDGGEVNMPTVRFGNISMMPAPITQPHGKKRETYCLDMHSRTGYSGSPVFVYRPPGGDLNAGLQSDAKGALLYAQTNFLLCLGIHIGQFAEIRKIKGTNQAATPSEGVELPLSEHQIEGVSGMTCVAPAWAIEDLLNMPKLKALRDAADAHWQRVFSTPAGLSPEIAVARSAAPAPPLTEGDGQSKERFSSLLDAAVGKSKQGG